MDHMPRLSVNELEQRLDALLFASPSYRSITRLASGLEPLSRARQELVLHWAGVAAQTFDEIGYLVASLAPSALALVDESGFEAWVLTSLDRYDREGLRPAMEQLRSLDAFCATRRGTPVAHLSEAEGRLTRFVHGLSGRALSVRPGPFAWTDTETIYLPEVLAELPKAEGNYQLYKCMAALLWAQTRYGTFNQDIAAALKAWPDYERALGWFVLLEAVRLDARIRAELPGLANEMATQRGPWPEALAQAVPRLAATGASVADSLALVPAYMEREPPTWPGLVSLDPATAMRVREERIARETQVLGNALAKLKQAAGKRARGAPELATARNSENDKFEFRFDGEAVALPPEAQAAAQSLVQELGAIPPEVLTPAGPGVWQPSGAPGAEPECVNDRSAESRCDEWDYHRQAYRRGWCHVNETEVKLGNRDYVASVRARYGHLIQQIRRRFEVLRGEDRILGRQPEGEEIDVDALVEAKCDRRSGTEPSQRLFCRRVRNERSLAAMFMVDMSGSTKGWVNDAEREALVMLCEAIETLGDAYAIYGFSGWTRTRCDIYRIKAFDERYDDDVRSRIAGIEAKDYTRMGFAIRHLTRLLVAQPARHKLLVTLSDGRPDDFGDEYRSRYGIEDTRRALLEAMRGGIRPFCITLDREAREYLPQLYGSARYTVIDDVARLPYKVADIYRRLTR